MSLILLALAFSFLALHFSWRSGQGLGKATPPYSRDQIACARWAWAYLLWAGVFLAFALYQLWPVITGGA